MIVSVLLVASALASCVTFTARGLSYGESARADEPVRRVYFEERVWVSKFFGSSAGTTLMNISQGDYDMAVARSCEKAMRSVGGIGVDDIIVTHEASAACIILNSLTLGIYAPSEIIVSGYVLVPYRSAFYPDAMDSRARADDMTGASAASQEQFSESSVGES